jgi:hypothetical protein
VLTGSVRYPVIHWVSFVRGTPVKYTDPSGHRCEDAHVAEGDCSNDTIDDLIGGYGVTLTGNWESPDKWTVLQALNDVGKAFSNLNAGTTAQEAFTSVYGNITITMGLAGATGDCAEITAGGCTSTPHQINFASLQGETVSGGGIIPENIAELSARNNVVHELGHAFGQQWYNADGTYDPSGPYGQIDDDLLLNEAGFAQNPTAYPQSAVYLWRQHPGDMSSSEIFADMFLGWTYNTWDSDDIGRGAFMEQHMRIW